MAPPPGTTATMELPVTSVGGDSEHPVTSVYRSPRVNIEHDSIDDIFRVVGLRTAGQLAFIIVWFITMTLVVSLAVNDETLAYAGVRVRIVFLVALCCFIAWVIKQLNRDADIVCCGKAALFPAKKRGHEHGATPHYDWSLSAFVKPMLQHLFGYRFWNADLLKDYRKAMAIVAALRSGDVVLIRGDYLVNLARKKQRLPRRQDLPREAILSAPPFSMVDMWRAMRPEMAILRTLFLVVPPVAVLYGFLGILEFRADPESIVNILSTWPIIAFEAGFFYFNVWLLPLQFLVESHQLVALSYLWVSPEHPDPNVEQLRFLAPLIESLEKDSGPSLFFIDYASLYQAPRTPRQTASFKRGLKSMVNLLYGSKKVQVWMNTEPPKSCGRK